MGENSTNVSLGPTRHMYRKEVTYEVYTTHGSSLGCQLRKCSCDMDVNNQVVKEITTWVLKEEYKHIDGLKSTFT